MKLIPSYLPSGDTRIFTSEYLTLRKNLFGLVVPLWKGIDVFLFSSRDRRKLVPVRLLVTVTVVVWTLRNWDQRDRADHRSDGGWSLGAGRPSINIHDYQCLWGRWLWYRVQGRKQSCGLTEGERSRQINLSSSSRDWLSLDLRVGRWRFYLQTLPSLRSSDIKM